MKYFLKHIKGIAYFLVILILFQSCVAYNSHNYTANEASQYNKGRIKIKTTDNTIYKLPWVEEKDGNVESIKNTKRAFVDKNEITQILPDGVSLEFALNYKTAVQIKTKNHTYNFIKIEEHEEQIKGLTMVSGDTLSVVIPIDQIEMIQLEDKGKSSGRTVGLLVGVGLGVALIVGLAVIASGFAEGGWFGD
jgi:hypothetical protein